MSKGNFSQERFRLNKKRYESVILTVCGLVRLRIGSLILEVIESPECGHKNDILMTHSFTPNLDDETPKANEIVALAQF